MSPELAGVLLIPLITALVEVAKRSGLPPRYAAGLALGVVLTTRSHIAGVLGLTDAYTAIIQGASYGLAAALYSGARFMVGAPPGNHAQGHRHE